MLIVFIIPVIVLFFSLLFRSATGPYWQFPDPSYGNLISSLSIVKHLSPAYIYSPGTSLQILGGAIIFLFNIGHSTSDTVHRVLLDPEFYLNAINISMIAFAFLTSLILGAYVYHQTNDKLAVFLSQLPVLGILALRSFSFYDYVLPVIANVSPEPLLISISSLFNLFLLKLFFAKKEQDETAMALLLGIICGLGIATKFTFATFLMLPLIVCRKWTKLLFLITSLVSFVFWTIPIIPFYTRLCSWISKLSTHVGEYGSGDQGIINLPQYLSNWHIILGKCPVLILFAFAAVFFSLVKIIKDRSSNRESTYLLATAFCILVQLGLIAKHYDEHYLVSAINLFSPLFVLFYLNVKNRGLFFKAVIYLCIIIFTVQSLGHALAYNKQLSGYTKDAVRFNNMLHAKYPDAVFVGAFPMPMLNPEAAFFMANDWDINQEDELSKAYPKNLAYFSNNVNINAPYVSGIYSIKERVWADDLIASGFHVIFVASKSYDFSQTPYSLLPIEQGEYAAAYLLTGSTEKESDMLFQASIKLSQAGDYPHAFAFALKANQLHYQPAGRVSYLLGNIYAVINPGYKKNITGIKAQFF